MRASIRRLCTVSFAHLLDTSALWLQLKRLNELEDIVADQDNSIAALREKLTRARQDVADWRFKLDEQIKQHDAEKGG